MLGDLPRSVVLDNGNEYYLNTDFRVALTIFEAYDDADLSDEEKTLVMITTLFEDYAQIPHEELSEACKKASEWLDGGVKYESKSDGKPVMNWVQDEQMIFSAVNRVAGQEVRATPYMHWWTFLGLMQEIDEKSLISTVIQLRTKKNSGKKLEKWEQDFYKKHKKMIDIPKKYTKEEKAERDAINRILNGGE